ncbi:MAG: AraC family transcriptional regulator [Eubacterium sp.]|nr:AraC family transcriptional regulator [Eubacterium sp.]MCM1216077.1 AraC family transcriptional regulator [Lachnospiraceae bacterium]MCM1239814.1 AraC family transcriptional regulator [Lachnospiraceae bacterium]MCM1343712.1 AraC family transcriptional regulator [Muribaculaceae bacterium]MCM1410188.1 AraC family transcriptional regulator [Lachnospiraceae bacterium]
MDHIAFCRSYFAITQIPVSLLEKEQPVYSALGEVLSIEPLMTFEMFPLQHNPTFCSLSPDIEYGRVHVEDTDYDVIVGPVFGCAMTDELVRKGMKELMIPLSAKESFEELLYQIPMLSHSQLGKHLLFLFAALNGHEADMEDLYPVFPTEDADRKNSAVIKRMEDLEQGDFHNTYFFEQAMMEKIKSGNPAALKIFFENNMRTTLNEGILAASPLRHAKNLFISAAVKTGFNGAIPGGLDIEKTYQLVDYYIQECEKLTTVEAVGNLMYAMQFDFCQRVGEAKIPQGISSDIYHCINFIQTHINEHISLDDVAAHIGRSASYVTKKFQQELGIHASAYITRCKLEEAKSLLTFTDKSLSEISAYLCFSSQSYFQNLFKKQYGITPMQYRENSTSR